MLLYIGIRLWATKDPSKGPNASGPKGLEPTIYCILLFPSPLRYNGTLHALAVIRNITFSAFAATTSPTAHTYQVPFCQLRRHFVLPRVFKRILALDHCS